MNLGAWSFLLAAVGSLLTVLLGRPWTTYIARRHTPPAVWPTPLFRETNIVMTLLWALLFGLAGLLAAWLPVWVQLPMGALLYVLGRLSPWLASCYAAWRRQALRLDSVEE
ncbi:MAG: hypothetical protein FJZ47_08110 [Candidatus Tectomicrobia bacterium]|uniref:Uncharacterized protein n=1 Tax=Tectimicrobiota bacterium TaxID=2528274 RepID=A0A937VZ33_UNCTE|nr:hypothetical protein [Candidatus Tectomicrobia bacterium]